jgi:hypothetical protein
MAATTLATALQALVSAGPAVLNPLAQHLTQSSSMTDAVDALLTEAQINPGEAAAIAIQIAAIPGVPKGVLAYTGQFAAVAGDKVAFATEIAQARAALEAATSPGTLGTILGNLL